jgi:hypothetical protein
MWSAVVQLWLSCSWTSTVVVEPVECSVVTSVSVLPTIDAMFWSALPAALVFGSGEVAMASPSFLAAPMSRLRP